MSSPSAQQSSGKQQQLDDSASVASASSFSSRVGLLKDKLHRSSKASGSGSGSRSSSSTSFKAQQQQKQSVLRNQIQMGY